MSTEYTGRHESDRFRSIYTARSTFLFRLVQLITPSPVRFPRPYRPYLVGQRLIILISGICFGGSVLLALASALIFSGQLRLNPAWSLLAAGALLAVAGIQIQGLLRANSDLTIQTEGRAELLRTQLEQQRQSIDTLADGLDIAIFICDHRAQILYANARARSFFKIENPIGRAILAVTLSYELEQLVLSASQILEKPEPDPSDSFVNLGKVGEIPFTYPEERVGQVHAWCPDVEEGRIFVSIYEITELRRLERVRQDFVANVSHELRTPMTLIRAMAETLLDEAPPEDELAHRYLSKITQEVDRLSAMTQDLLILSSAESNPVRKQRCDLADVVRSTVSQLMTKSKDKGLELEFSGPTSLIIEANPSQMTQVAINLIENAINYTHQGSVGVRLRDEGAEVVFEVQDSGIGISSENQARVFERFYRVDRGRSRSTGGTGLGLSIVKHITEAHGGSVSLQSTLGMGSTFIVRLPVGDLDGALELGT